jgi:GT2 family glycosyltransferase
MSLFSVSLLTYNGCRYIANCLKSVLSQTYPAIEVLLIDNGSSDETVESAKAIIEQVNPKFPIRIIRNEKNLGFSGGHNLGIEQSRGEFILFLNQDVVLAPDFIEQAAGYLAGSNRDIGSLQPKILKLDKELRLTDIIDTTGLVVLKNRRIINRGQGEKDAGQYDQPDDIFGPDGAAPVYSREALEDSKKGGEYFDEEFFMYKEDVDLAWRMRLFGWQSVFLPTMKAWHARSAGEGAAMNYLSIIQERRKIDKFGKFLAFRNQRLLQIKNELPILLLKHLPRFLFKEIGSWLYVVFFEPATLKAIKDLIKMMPLALKKRKMIMAHKKVGFSELEKWFK